MNNSYNPCPKNPLLITFSGRPSTYLRHAFTIHTYKYKDITYYIMNRRVKTLMIYAAAFVGWLVNNE